MTGTVGRESEGGVRVTSFRLKLSQVERLHGCRARRVHARGAIAADAIASRRFATAFPTSAPSWSKLSSVQPSYV
jgi:hypothetical protein